MMHRVDLFVDCCCRQSWANGGYYDGDWIDGKPRGHGKLISIERNTCYEGEYVYGRGILTLTQIGRRIHDTAFGSTVN